MKPSLLSLIAIIQLSNPGLAQLPARPQPPQIATPAPQLPTLAPDTGRAPAERRYLPSAVNEPLMSMTIQVVKETTQGSTYRSRHFEFNAPVKLGSGTMKEICRAFESTHELVSKLPWGILPWPQGGPFFHAELYESRAAYLATGAPQWSAANYSMKDRIFRIPFEEVGVVSRGSSYYLGGTINNNTITHEVTHQMMHEYLRYMPIWLTEGTAEYTANLPYASGRYNVAGAVEEFKQKQKNPEKIKRRAGQRAEAPNWVGAENLWGYTTSIAQRRVITDFAFVPPPKPTPSSGPLGDLGGLTMILPPQMDLPDPGLGDRYYSSHALVLFFMHFDGDGKATRLKKYFDAIHEERKRWADFDRAVEAFNGEVTKYQAAWEAFKKTPGVEDLGGGRIRFPSNLTPPAAPTPPVGPGNTDPTKVCVKHLGILLDGRSFADLDREFRAAFAKAGIPIEDAR